MLKLTIGGVPEHFNLPIHLAIERGDFRDAGIDLHWESYPGGSGEMKEALLQGETDLCILLTEGIVSAILDGNPSKIVSGFVKTSLTWGIHARHDWQMGSKTLFDYQIAISRRGSGSHLMPIVQASMEDQKILSKQFVEVGTMEGGFQALQRDQAQLFYWEKYTTKPHLDKNRLKRIGEFNSPWPCFVIAASTRILDTHSAEVKQCLGIIHNSCKLFMNDPTSPTLVATKYQQEQKDAERWFHATEWATDGWVSNKMIDGVLFSLREAGISSKSASTKDLIWQKTV